MKNANDILFLMAKKEKYLLTVSVSLKDLAEFSAATDILGQRTNTAFVYQFMMQKVREAKNSVTEKEFNDAVNEKTQEILARSRQKSIERNRSLSSIKSESTKKDNTIDINNSVPYSKPSARQIMNDDEILDVRVALKSVADKPDHQQPDDEDSPRVNRFIPTAPKSKSVEKADVEEPPKERRTLSGKAYKRLFGETKPGEENIVEESTDIIRLDNDSFPLHKVSNPDFDETSDLTSQDTQLKGEEKDVIELPQKIAFARIGKSEGESKSK